MHASCHLHTLAGPVYCIAAAAQSCTEPLQTPARLQCNTEPYIAVHCSARNIRTHRANIQDRCSTELYRATLNPYKVPVQYKAIHTVHCSARNIRTHRANILHRCCSTELYRAISNSCKAPVQYRAIYSSTLLY